MNTPLTQSRGNLHFRLTSGPNDNSRPNCTQRDSPTADTSRFCSAHWLTSSLTPLADSANGCRRATIGSEHGPVSHTPNSSLTGD